MFYMGVFENVLRVSILRHSWHEALTVFFFFFNARTVEFFLSFFFRTSGRAWRPGRRLPGRPGCLPTISQKSLRGRKGHETHAIAPGESDRSPLRSCCATNCCVAGAEKTEKNQGADAKTAGFEGGDSGKPNFSEILANLCKFYHFSLNF